MLFLCFKAIRSVKAYMKNYKEAIPAFVCKGFLKRTYLYKVELNILSRIIHLCKALKRITNLL